MWFQSLFELFIRERKVNRDPVVITPLVSKYLAEREALEKTKLEESLAEYREYLEECKEKLAKGENVTHPFNRRTDRADLREEQDLRAYFAELGFKTERIPFRGCSHYELITYFGHKPTLIMSSCGCNIDYV